MIPVRLLRLDVVVAGVFVMAVAVSAATPAHAQDTANNPFMEIARKAKLLPEPVEPKDFVKQSRPAQTEYLPVGTMPPDRPLKVKSPDELKAMQAELEAARSRHDRIAGRPPPKAQPAPPASKSAVKNLKGSHPGRANAKDPKA